MTFEINSSGSSFVNSKHTSLTFFFLQKILHFFIVVRHLEYQCKPVSGKDKHFCQV